MNTPRPVTPAALPVRLSAGPEALGLLAGRLTPRDRLLLELLHEHHVFTLPQINSMFFGSLRYAETRMLELYRMRAVDRFRPFATTGSAPYHYLLDELGAAIVAAARGTTPAQLGYRRASALAIAHSRTLEHLLGVNGFFASLVTYSRTRPEAVLTEWLSERRAVHAFAERVHPDGYGRWHDPAGKSDVAFFVEYDTGSEPLKKVADKLDAYTRYAHQTGTRIPVLFVLPSPARETNLRQRLNAWTDNAPLPAATTNPEAIIEAATDDATHQISAAGPCWAPVDRDSDRLRLIDLASAWDHIPHPILRPSAYDLPKGRYSPDRPPIGPRPSDTDWPPIARVHGGLPPIPGSWIEDDWS